MPKEEVCCHAFGVRPIPEQKPVEFEDYYLSIEIYDKVVKTGEGENDFIVVKDVKYSKTPIQEVVDADKDSVGVDNIIKMVLRTGDTSLLPSDKGNPDVDLVNAPEDLMQLKAMGVEAEKKFAGLDPELTKGMNMADFVKNLTQEQFDAFVKAVADRSSGKVEEKNE